MEKKILVLSVDRDDDLGRKANIKGLVVGRDKNIEAATKLALADPEDSDANTIFEAVKIYDKLKKEKKQAEVATVTGDQNVGVESDIKIARQVEKILKKTESKQIILVTDGTEDEHVMPIIQNQGKILSIRRVVMKQSERLEGMYYMVNEFIHDPKMSRFFLGIPAITLLLYALFGETGWRIILGGVGAYLLIKGFQLEGLINGVLDELKTSFSSKRISFFLYIVSLIISFISLKGGYDAIIIHRTTDLIESTAVFLNGSVYLLFLSVLVALGGKAVYYYPNKKGLMRCVILASLSLSIALVTFEASEVILSPGRGMLGLFGAVAFGFLLIVMALILERVLT